MLEAASSGTLWVGKDNLKDSIGLNTSFPGHQGESLNACHSCNFDLKFEAHWRDTLMFVRLWRNSSSVKRNSQH